MMWTLQKYAPGFHVHGFRTSFRKSVSATGRDRDLAEASMAHIEPGSTTSERAYSRPEDAPDRETLDRRRDEIMQPWSNHCLGTTGGFAN